MGNLEKDDLAGLDANQRLHRLGDELTACSGIEVKYRRVKSTGEDKIRSYVVPGRKQPISASRLGDRYTRDGLMEQLDLVEKGRWRPYEAQGAGPPREITELSDEQTAQLQQDVDQIAQEERALQAAEGVDAVEVEHEGYRSERLAQRYGSDMEARRPQPAAQVEEAAPAATPGSAASSQRPEGDAAKQQPTGAAAKPARRSERQLGLLHADQMKDVELIAVVRGERTDGGAYVDFQVSADHPLARDQAGLHLMAQRQERKGPDGSVRRGVRTWHQLSASQYEKVKAAGAENGLDVDGRPTMALRGNIMPSTSGRGYTINPASVQPSKHEPIGPDVMDRQRASEDRARERARERRADRGQDASEWASRRFTAAAERESAGLGR